MMRNHSLIVVIIFVLAWSNICLAGAGDWRDFSSGYRIPDENYCDQPYIVKTQDGNWLCVLTTGQGREGRQGQHIAASISQDKGKTWSELIDIEPANGPEASWAIPLMTAFGRVYVFYDFNGDDVGHGNPAYAMKDGRATYRADMLGWYCYKYSDDNGRTWSKRYRLEMPEAGVDRLNQWGGKVQVFWGIDKPKVDDSGTAFFAFTRLGRWVQELGEGWIYRSENIMTERDADKIEWQLLSQGGKGIRDDVHGSVQEEHNIVPLGGGRMYCVYRTQMGYPCNCYSDDSGKTWTRPVPMTQSPGGRRIRTPQACPKLWKTENGRYLFWFHNNGCHSVNRDAGYGSRNVAWLCGGRMVDGKLHWSEPEIVRYCEHPLEGCSYPDLVEDDGRYYISATQKTEARINEIPAKVLEDLWRQDELNEVVRDGLVLEADEKQIREVKDTKIPIQMPKLGRLDKGEGFTIDMWIRLDRSGFVRVLLNSQGEQGSGIAIRSTMDDTIRLDMTDGIAGVDWACDRGMIEAKQIHHVVFVVDGGPKVISVIVDGVLCNGGENGYRRYGWGRFLMTRHLIKRDHSEVLKAHELGDVTGGDTVNVERHQVKHLRIYNRALRTSEVISNYHAGVK